MNVLSLFDGISAAQLALQCADMNVDNYFASETDEYAIKVTQNNWPNTTQLGDVTKIKGRDLPDIDLLIGGSPCQGFSYVGKKLNFNDERSKLFFEFMRILNECLPKYFLLENVPMNECSRNIITEYTGVEPEMINSNKFSKQRRKRLYWTDINILPITPKNDFFNQWLYRRKHGYFTNELKIHKYFPTITRSSNDYKIVTDIEKALSLPIDTLSRDKTCTRYVYPEELEEFQTLPIKYTSSVSKTNRRRLIANSFTTDVIAHILKTI